MTCVSLRSGIASSGTVFIDHTPAMTAAVTTINTTKRFFAENSMMRLITAVSLVWRGWRAHSACSSPELTLRIDEERAGCNDALAGRKPAVNGDAIAETITNHDCPGFEIAVAQIDENGLAVARVEQGIRRDRQPRRAGDAEFDVDEHLGSHARTGIAGIESH